MDANNLLEKVIDKNEITPFIWGDACKAWYLIDKENMGVFYETMPPGSIDQYHFHKYSNQFIFVLSGTLNIKLNDQIFLLTAFKGIEIPKGTPHKIYNRSNQNVDFILFANPNHDNDRVEIAEINEG